MLSLILLLTAAGNAAAPPMAGQSAGAEWPGAGERLTIDGRWHFVGAETKPDNRFAYFIDTTQLRRGRTGEAWLVTVFERPYRDGAASRAYRVRVDCTAGQWRFDYDAIRDASFRILRIEPSANWRSSRLDPKSPVARVGAVVCEDASPGEPLPAELAAPADFARRWFARNPR